MFLVDIASMIKGYMVFALIAGQALSYLANQLI